MRKDRALFEVSERMYDRENQAHTPQTVAMLYVMAPVLCRYVLWVLQNAMRTGKRRLYFLARDGYSMYRTAKVICEAAELPIECRYLYCSRYAWRSAEYGLLGKDSLSYICLGGIEVSFAGVMRRAGLSKEEALEVAVLLGYADHMYAPLSYSGIKDMKPLLAECPLFMEKLETHSREKYPAVCGYLRQEGLLEDVSYAIVDSGWTGSMQKCLKHLLQSMGYQRRIEGYYFGMYEYPVNADRTAYHTYYFGPEEEIRRKVYFSNSLFECVFSSPEGMTTGYEEQNGRYYPTMEHPHNPNLKKIERSTDLLVQYAGILAEGYPGILSGQQADFPAIAAQLLYLFMGRPTASEAEEFGSYIFCDDVIGEESRQVAAPLTAEELKKNHILRKGMNVLLKSKVPVRESAWQEGSAVLAGDAGRRELGHCAFYKYILYLRKRMK